MIAVLALLGAPCAGLAAAQQIDRSRPPVIDPSTGGFTIRALGPVVVDGKQWLAVTAIQRGRTFAAPDGQFTALTDPNEEGDVRGYRVTFTERELM